MVHEYSQFNNGKISLSKESDEFKEFQEIKSYNLTEAHDKFFEKHLMSDFGIIAKESTDALKNLKNSNPKIKDMKTEDLGDVIDKLPELKRKRAFVIKHIDIVSDLTDKIKKHGLIKLRDVEHDILEGEKYDEIMPVIRQILVSKDIRDVDKVRLSLMFSLVHFKKDIYISEILQLLKSQNIPEVINIILAFLEQY